MIKHMLKASLERNIPVTIIYQKGSEITERSVKVMGMDGSSIRAFCYLRQQIRVFSTDNILSASLHKPKRNSGIDTGAAAI